jgi:hypothetical protein
MLNIKHKNGSDTIIDDARHMEHLLISFSYVKIHEVKLSAKCYKQILFWNEISNFN